jgi:hypothetical protein
VAASVPLFCLCAPLKCEHLSLFQNRLFCHPLLQFFGLGPAKLRILKVAVPKTEVLEQPHYNGGFWF